MVKHLSTIRETWVQSLGWEDSLGKEMTTHSSILAWRIPWTEKPSGLSPMGSQSWTWLSDLTTMTTTHKRHRLSLVCQKAGPLYLQCPHHLCSLRLINTPFYNTLCLESRLYLLRLPQRALLSASICRALTTRQDSFWMLYLYRHRTSMRTAPRTLSFNTQNTAAALQTRKRSKLGVR